MASFFFAPDPLQSTFLIPGGVVPGNGVQVFIYVAGSVSTKTTVYKDNAGNAAWVNPIVLDSGGNLPNGGVIWIPSGVSIKAVWAPSNDTDPPASPYRTIDNIAGINDVVGSQTEWTTGPTPTFVSSSQFTLVGDQTSTFTKGRRVKFTVTAGTVYGVITTSSFAVLTTINVAFDSGGLDSGLSAVSYSVVSPVNSSIAPDYIYKYATTVPSAGSGTTNIWGIAGDYTHITGTNTISSFSTAPYPGARRTVIFDGALTLSHNSPTIQMPGGANVTTAANDRADIRADSVSTSIVTFSKANGFPVLSSTLGTPQSLSSTVVNFTGIPSWAKKLTVQFAGLSTNGTSNAIVQIGPSGGIESSGYSSTALTATGGGNSVFQGTTGFPLGGAWTAAYTYHGAMTFSLENSSNRWVASWTGGNSEAVVAHSGGGSKAIAGTLDRFRVTTVNGIDTFDAGEVNYIYE